MRIILALLITLSAAAANAPADSGLKKVWVAPFTESGTLLRPGWLSYRLNQSVTEELTRLRKVELLPDRDAKLSAGQRTEDLLATARSAGADFVVTGNIKSQNDQLAAVGDVLDTQTGRSIGDFKATGAARDLFAVEDSAARQVSVILTAAAETAPAVAVAPTTAPAPALPPVASTPGARFQASELAQSLNDPKSFTQYARDTTPQRTDPTDSYYSYGGYAPSTYYPYNSYPGGYSPFGYWGGWSGWDLGWPGTIIIQRNVGSQRHHLGSGFRTTVTPDSRQSPLNLPPNPLVPNPPSLVPNPPSLVPNPPSLVPNPPSNVAQPRQNVTR